MTAAVIRSGSRAFMWQDSQRSTMLASATLICTILGSHSSVFFFRPSIWVGRQVHHVVCNEGGHLVAGLGNRLQHITQFRAHLGPLILERVVSLFQFVEVVLLPVAVGKFDGGLFFLYSSMSCCLLFLPEALVSVSSW